jgi:anti-sigma B factor antagonist
MIFSVEVRRTADQSLLKLSGDLNALAQEPFEAAADRALAGPPAELILDFGETTFVNSTGIALIVSLLGRARTNRVLVIARGLDDHHRHIFTITRLSDFMNIEEPDTIRTDITSETNAGGNHG